ncbi:RTA1 like protein-domain-containing protein [Ilyonectria robusta]|uniref:RTA1 like protein-domain-containing protein n=1 Tax=Ilyonectria robusta TaxID=1079257 RepID=UPI001E8CC032|nr:RTA1 like protein-domain-containing protein [Ilyonectria robusta]KAH8665447.1 RTA1 like protein-domain-containing protein [Ilyonectria robusta]
MSDDEFNFYNYKPSSAAAMIFLLAFGLATLWHLYIILSRRAWYFTPLLCGCILESLGYVGRFLNSYNPTSITPFMIQSLCLLVAPALVAASIYMVFGRLILFLHASSLSPIKPTRMTKIFVAGDVISFLIQYIGGGLLSKQKSFDTGKMVILIGLAAQIVLFGLFTLAAVVFHLRIIDRPLQLLPVEDSGKFFKGWRGVMVVLYVSSGLVLVRSLYRLVEYTTDRDGPLGSHEAYFYMLDSVLMLGAVAIIAILHPIMSRPKRPSYVSKIWR